MSTNSEESNDMMMNHPDIETIENIRKRKQKKNDSKELELEGQLRMEEKLEKKQEKDDRKELERELRKEEKQEMEEWRELQKELRKEEKILKKLEAEEEHKRKEELRKLKKIEFEEQRIEKRQMKQQMRLEQIKANEERKQKALEEKRIAEEAAIKERKNKALNGMKYLLNVSEKYSDFFREKILSQNEGSSKGPLQERKDKNKLQPTISDMKEAASVKTKQPLEKDLVDVKKMMKYFEGGELREYQVDGVQWMNTLFDNGINGILADEMGLGKTVQVIALIAHLMQRHIPGPYLIIAPLSTIPNWELEFKRFAPKIPVVVFHGSQDERAHQYSLLRKKYTVGSYETYPVVLTTYQVPIIETKFLQKFRYQFVIVDEGHRIKNHETKLSLALRSLNSSNRLLLTGTPIHNNITELWALLNFLMPHLFNNVDTFASLLMLEDMDNNKIIEQEEQTNLLTTLHRVIEPFVLRRLKKDVLGDVTPKKEMIIFCPLSRLQRNLYTYVLDKNIEALRKQEDADAPLPPRKAKRKSINYVEYINDDDDFFSDDESLADSVDIKKEDLKVIIRLTMTNPLMMYKKIVDHPYLVHFPLDTNAQERKLLINEDLITNSGKMIVLDKMLKSLKENGHKVLIFSTLVMVIDLIEEMFLMRNYTYSRLDGSYDLEMRKDNIEAFNKDPNILAFLLSTRSGGLGLNLVAADTVIFFDRDWNPQADIQAQDRCHRIGQTRPVMVYTLVTKGTIDEQIIERGHKKRLLEKVVIKDGKFMKQIGAKPDASKLEQELMELKKLLDEENNTFQHLGVSNQEMDQLLDRTELYAQMGLKYKAKKVVNSTDKENINWKNQAERVSDNQCMIIDSSDDE